MTERLSVPCNTNKRIKKETTNVLSLALKKGNKPKMGKAKITENTYATIFESLQEINYSLLSVPIPKLTREDKPNHERNSQAGKVLLWKKKKKGGKGRKLLSKWLRNNYLYYCSGIQESTFANCFEDSITQLQNLTKTAQN